MDRMICFVLFAFALFTVDASAQYAPGQQTPDEDMHKIENMAHQIPSGPMKVPKDVKVMVEADKPRGILMPWTLGVHTLASDQHLTDACCEPQALLPSATRVDGLPILSIGRRTIPRHGRGSAIPT